MKKVILLSIVIFVIIVLVGGGTYIMFFEKNKKVGAFKLIDYNYFIENFPTEKVLGPIDSAKLAKEKAEVIWKEIYGESIKGKKTYKVAFDYDNQVWLVYGDLPKKWDGGVPYILIQKSDGKVLAVWHSK